MYEQYAAQHISPFMDGVSSKETTDLVLRGWANINPRVQLIASYRVARNRNESPRVTDAYFSSREKQSEAPIVSWYNLLSLSCWRFLKCAYVGDRSTKIANINTKYLFTM